MIAVAKARPIIFTGSSVPLIRIGKKTQTRRIVSEPYQSQWEKMLDDGRTFVDASGSGDVDQFCRYGKVGNQMYVKETWAPYRGHFGCDVAYKVSPERFPPESESGFTDEQQIWLERYERRTGRGVSSYLQKTKWASPYFMPRWASRLLLEVISVRAERIQDISEEDAIAEGIQFDGTYWRGGIHPVKGTQQCWPTARRAFQAEWDRIHAKKGHGWDQNDWVFPIKFKLVA